MFLAKVSNLFFIKKIEFSNALPSNFCCTAPSFQAAANQNIAEQLPTDFIFYIKSEFPNRFETRFQATLNCFQAAVKNTAEQLPAEFYFLYKI